MVAIQLGRAVPLMVIAAQWCASITLVWIGASNRSEVQPYFFSNRAGLAKDCLLGTATIKN